MRHGLRSCSILVALIALAHVPAWAADRPIVHRGLVILTQFPDVRHQVDRRLVETRFSQHLGAYVREMSYGTAALQFDVTPQWYTLPEGVDRYRISPRNLEVDTARVRKLIDAALEAVDRDARLEDYDFVVLFLGARVADYGMVGLCGYPGMLGWSTDRELRTKSGRRINGGVAIYTHEAHLGTLFHDIAHILGGVKDGKRRVPCLYDHDLQARPGPLRETFENAIVNLGFWDPMSCHYYRRLMGPPGLSSWTKLRLNWLDASKVSVVEPHAAAEVLLGPLADGSSTTLAIRMPISRTTYYLVENRQPIGFDRNLPGSGVLIMLADDDVAECRRGRAPVRLVDADPATPHLEGAAFNLGARSVFRDAGHGIEVTLLDRVGDAYKVRVTRR